MSNEDRLLELLRPALGQGVRTVHAAVMRAADDVALSLELRAMASLRVAQVTSPGQQASRDDSEHGLSKETGALVAAPSRWDELPAATAHALAYVEQIALDPADIGPTEVRDLEATGFSPEQVVLLSQVAAYSSFRARLNRGLSLLVDGTGIAPRRPPCVDLDWSGLPTADEQFPALDWVPSVRPAPVPDTPAGADLRTPHVWSPFYLTLLHDPTVLGHRTALYNAIMTGVGALDRVDRELAALATSLATGCRYCSAVHGQRQVRLAGEHGPAVALARHGVDALPNDRQYAIAVFAQRMAPTPPSVCTDDVARLRKVGLDDNDICDLVAVTAMFAWANRLMMTLGTSRPSEVRSR